MKGAALSFGLALLVLALRWPALSLPLDRDEGAYATVAWAAQERGSVPYVDLLDHKPPLLYGLYAEAFRWGGPSPLALRLFSLLWQMLSATALGLLLLRWTGSGATAAVGGALFGLLASAWGTQAVTANAEGWAWLPLIAGLALLRPWDEERSTWRWVAWGLAAGLAANIKQPYYLWALGLPLCWPAPASRTKALLAALLGLLALQALVAYECWRQDALAAWAFAVFRFHEGYGWPFSLAALHALLGLLGRLAPEQGLCWALAGLAWTLPGSRLRRLGAACLSLGLAAAALSGRWYPHYAQHWSLGLALLGAAALQENAGERWIRWGALLLALAAFVWAQRPYWMLRDGLARSERLMGVVDFAQAPALASGLRGLSRPQDRLLIWGAEAQLYFLAQRLPATRQLSHYALTGVTPRWPGAEEDFLGAAADERTGVVLLAEGLDPGQPFQASLGRLLQAHFQFRRDLFPPYWIGLRRRAGASRTLVNP